MAGTVAVGVFQPEIVGAAAYARYPAAVVWYRGEAGVGGEASGVGEAGEVAAGGGDEVGAQGVADAGHAGDQRGVEVSVEACGDPVLDLTHTLLL